MNRKAITIYACGALFCVSLFVAIAPIATSDGLADLLFHPKMIAALLLGWVLIITTCVFLVKCNKKKRPR